MKKTLFCALSGLMIFGTANANMLTWENQYVSIGGLYGFGETKQDIKVDYEVPDTETSTSFSKDKQNAFGVDVAYGANFYEDARAEVSFAYKYLDINSDGQGIYSGTKFDWNSSNFYQLMANLYYDFDTETAFTPYVGLGLGFGYTDFKFKATGLDNREMDIKYSEFGMIYNLMAGVSYSITDKFALDLKYRFVGIPEDISYELERTVNMEVDAELNYQPFHEFVLSARYKF